LKVLNFRSKYAAPESKTKTNSL